MSIQYPLLQESSGHIEPRVVDQQRNIQYQHFLKLKKTKTFRLRSLFILSIILAVSFITALLFIIKYSQSKSRLQTYTKQIDQLKFQYNQLLTQNRTFDLSSSNIIGFQTELNTQKDLPLTLLNLSNNLIQELLNLSITSSRLKTIDLRNNPLVSIRNCNFLMIDQIYFPKAVMNVADSVFGFKVLPQQLKEILRADYNIFKQVQQIVIEDSLIQTWNQNRAPKAKRIILNNTMLQVFIFKTDIPVDLYISSNCPESYHISITINGEHAGFNVEIVTRGRTSIDLYSAKQVDMNKINCPAIYRLVVENTVIRNSDRRVGNLATFYMRNITGIRVFNLSNYPDLNLLKLINTDTQSIVFDPDVMHNLSQLRIENTSIAKLNGLRSETISYMLINQNLLLTELSNNYFPHAVTIQYSENLVYILNNNFNRQIRLFTSETSNDCYLPEIKKVSNNDYSNLQNVTLSNGKLEELANNTFLLVQNVLLDNNNLNDGAVEQLINSNAWNIDVLKFINLTNNPIENKQVIRGLINDKFPDVTLEI